MKNNFPIKRALSCLILLLIILPLKIVLGQNLHLQDGHFTNDIAKDEQASSSIAVRQMFFLDSATGWVVGNSGWMVKTTSGGAQWTQENPSTQNNIYYVFFTNRNVGWICGQSGMIQKTSDGGNTWIPQVSGTNNDLSSVYFTNPNQGWAAGGTSGIILSTQNGGGTWTPQESGVNVHLQNTFFVDANHGWICGDSGIIVHTSNGGINWTSQKTNTTTYLWWIDFPDLLHGYAVGGNYNTGTSVFLSTADGGITWVPQMPAYAPLFGTSFLNDDTGWVSGRSGTILKTTNGGNTWTNQSYDGLWLAQISFMTNNIGYAITGDPALVVTTDGGNSWNTVNINATIPVESHVLYITDVPNDNGKQVFIKWTTNGSPINSGLTNFSIYRYDQQAWTYIKDVPVLLDSVYQTIVPTLYDSTIFQGIHFSVFKVIAHTSNPSVYITIGTDSGYSVDNLPPLAPTSGTAIQLSNGNVVIRWHSAENIYGDFKQYVLYRSAQPDFVPSPTTRIAFVQDTVYTDLTVQGNRVYYKTTSMDYSGNESQPLVISTTTSVELVNSQVPQTYSLAQNYPNPFNPSTQIQFSIVQLGYVTLKVFDLSGKEVASLISQEMPPGTYTVPFSAKNLSSGMYFYRLEAGIFLSTKKMLIVK